MAKNELKQQYTGFHAWCCSMVWGICRNHLGESPHQILTPCSDMAQPSTKPRFSLT